MNLSTLAGMKTMDPYDRCTVGPRVLAKVLQEIPARHPRGHRAKLADVRACTESRDHVEVD